MSALGILSLYCPLCNVVYHMSLNETTQYFNVIFKMSHIGHDSSSYQYILHETLLWFSRYRSFMKMMLKWNGAVFKLIWHDLLLFLIIYFCLDFIYIFWLKEDPAAVEYKELFEMICIYCGRFKGKFILKKFLVSHL